MFSHLVRLANYFSSFLDGSHVFSHVVSALRKILFWTSFKESYFVQHKRFVCAHKMNNIRFFAMRGKRSSKVETPTSSPTKGSPKKMKTPPKKDKTEQQLTHGQPCQIVYHRCAEAKLWQVTTLDDKSDAFMKNIIDKLRSDHQCHLRTDLDFRGDVAWRVSLTNDDIARNDRKNCERKFLVQMIEDNDTPEHRSQDCKRNCKGASVSIFDLFVWFLC